MKPARVAAHVFNCRARGFTLVETLIVMVVLGIAAVTVANLSSSLFQGQTTNREIVVGSQLMQECAESLLAKGRNLFSDSCLADSAAATACCSSFTATGYSAPTVTLTAGNSGTTAAGNSGTTVLPPPGMAACPNSAGSDCKLISVTQGGLKPVTLMLILN